MYARFADKPWVLYDLRTDPYQMRNLADDPSARKIQGAMEKKLLHWMEEAGDRWDYNWTAPVEDNGRLYRHRTFYTVPEYLQWARENPTADTAR